MRNIMLIAGKEFRAYLTSPMAYIVTAIFLALTGVFFVYYLASTSYNDTSIRGFVENGSVFLLLFAAIITMRTLAEEKKLGTWELLLTSPVRDTEVIVGKFLGSITILIVMLVLTLYYPFLLIIFGDPDIGPIMTSYLGMFLLGSAAFAVGIFASSLTNNQIVSAVVSGAILFVFWFLGTVANSAPEALQKVIGYISLQYHFSAFVIGIIDTQALVYYISFTVLFLYLAVRSLENSRWS